MKTDYDGIIIPDFLVIMQWIKKEGKCAYDLLREVGITYKHLHELKHTFLKLGWITLVKERRRHNMVLTTKGKKIVEISDSLFAAMDMKEEDILRYVQKSKLKKEEKVDIKKLMKEVEDIDNNDIN